MSDANINVSQLVKRFGVVRAVDDLSFSVQPGRVTGFLGPNGSGKTTTLKILLGLAAPTSGTATVCGRRYADLPEPARTVGAVLDGTGAHPARSGRDHLRVMCAAAGVSRTRVDEVLEQVGLTAAAGRRFGEYSLGMRQRLAVAQALLGEPEVLILDEPMNGLDPQGIHWMRELLRGQAAAGCTVLVSSHLLSEVALVADDVVIISAGRLVVEGPTGEITKRLHPTSRLRVQVAPAEAVADRLRSLGATVAVEQQDVLIVEGLDATAVAGVAMESGGRLGGISEEQVDLEAAFLALTDGRAEIR